MLFESSQLENTGSNVVSHYVYRNQSNRRKALKKCLVKYIYFRYSFLTTQDVTAQSVAKLGVIEANYQLRAMGFGAFGKLRRYAYKKAIDQKVLN